MKIIIANYRYFLSGGPEQYMFKFMKLASSKGVEIIPFSINYTRNKESKYSNYFASPAAGKDATNFDEFKRTPLSLIRIVSRAFYNLNAKKRLSKLIKYTKPDLLYIIHQSGTLSPSIIDSAKKHKIPVIHRISDFNMICSQYKLLRKGELCTLCMKGKYLNAVKHKCVQKSFGASSLRALSLYFHRKIGIYKKVDAFITTVNSTRDILIQDGILAPDKIHTVNTFVDIDVIVPNYSSKNYVLALGRLNDEKGFIYAILAMDFLKDTDIKLCITGELDNNSEISKIIEAKNLTDRIQFVGFKNGNELDQLISNSSCVISPSIWLENLPNVVIEAFAYGKPVIGSNHGSYKEIIDDGVDGYLVNPKNPKEIANKIRELLSDPLKTQNMGRAARKKAEEKFNSELHWNKFIDVYNLIKEGK